MEIVQVGIMGLRGPDGKFLPGQPIYSEVPDEEAEKIKKKEEKMLDEGATDLAKAMRRYIKRFHNGENI